jgi:hypothetical protein
MPSLYPPVNMAALFSTFRPLTGPYHDATTVQYFYTTDSLTAFEYWTRVTNVMYSSFGPYHANKLSFQWNRIKRNLLVSTGSSYDVYGDAGTEAGTATWASPPPAVCALIQKNTARYGRTGVGRAFMPAGFLQRDEIEANGLLTSDERTRLADNWGPIPTELATENTIMVLWNRPGSYLTEVVDFTVVERVGTSRRRQVQSRELG